MEEGIHPVKLEICGAYGNAQEEYAT